MEFSHIHVSIGLSQIAFPIIVLPKDDHTDFAQEERLGLPYCEGCDIVQSDHAPQAGVAQGIFNGDLIRRRVGHQVELEEELEEEVERRVRRDHSRDKTQVRMLG